MANNNKPFKCTKAYINLSAIEAKKNLYPLTKVAFSYFFSLIPNKYIYSNPILFVSKIWSLLGIENRQYTRVSEFISGFLNFTTYGQITTASINYSNPI